MKKVIFGLIFACFIFLQLSCSGDLENSIKFRNLAQESIRINFRGEEIRVTPGNTAEVKNIPKGTYTYNTTYTVPASTLSASTQGAVSGDVTISVGTKVLIIYSSTFIDKVYTLYATISSSDDNSTTTSP